MLIKGLKKYFIGFSIFSVATMATLGITFGLNASSSVSNNNSVGDDSSNLPNDPNTPGNNTPNNPDNNTPNNPDNNTPNNPDNNTPNNPEVPPVEKPGEESLLLVPNWNLTSSMFKLENLTVDEAIRKMTKEWIVENKNILFLSGQDKLTVDKITNLVFVPVFGSNNENNANIQITINNNVVLNISSFSIIPESASLYELQNWPLGVGQAINISSYITDKTKVMEAISNYILDQQNNYVNSQKDFYMTHYVLDRKNLFQSTINNDQLIWSFDLKGKTKEFKNALSLILFRKNWDNLFSNLKNVSQYISNFNVTFKVQPVEGKIDRYKVFATNVELTFEQEISSSSRVVNKVINLSYNSIQQSSSSYELIFSKDTNSSIGKVILIDNSLLLALTPLNSTIYVDSFKGLGSAINLSIEDIQRGLTRDVIYTNKDVIFNDSYLLAKVDFIESVTAGDLVGSNYDKFTMSIKWKNILDPTIITFAISQDNRIKNLGLHNIWKTPVSNKNIGIYTDLTNMFELRKRIPPLMYYEQIEPLNNKNSQYHSPEYNNYTLYARPRYIDATDDSVYVQLSTCINNKDLESKNIYYNMLFRSIWKSMTWDDFKNQTPKGILPTMGNLIDIRLEYQLVKLSESRNRIEAKLYPRKVIMYYNDGAKVEWEYSQSFVDSNNIATPIHFIVDPSMGNKYKVVEL